MGACHFCSRNGENPHEPCGKLPLGQDLPGGGVEEDDNTTEDVIEFDSPTEAMDVESHHCRELRATGAASSQLRGQEEAAAGQRCPPARSDEEVGDQIQAAMANIRQLCREVRLFEAIEAVTSLEKDLASTFLGAGHCSEERGRMLAEAKTLLQTDAEIKKLRAIHGRFLPYLAPDGLLVAATRGSSDAWVHQVKKEPLISEHFRIEVSTRCLEGKERDANGPATQLVVKVALINWPQELDEAVALDRETDLQTQKNIEDCRFYEGRPGSLDQLFSSMLHYVIRPKLFPLFSLDFLQMREYAICRRSPLSRYSAGVFVTEETAPAVENHEGWQVPALQGTLRVTMKSIKHIASSMEQPNCSNQTMIMKVAASVPRAFFSLKLANNIILNTTLSTFISCKTDILDNWAQHNTADRLAAAKTFYEAVNTVKLSPAEARAQVAHAPVGGA